MPGRKTSILNLFVACAGAGLAAHPDYFPLHVGNQWVYRGTGTRGETTLVLEITRTADFDGRRYWLLHGLPQRDYWLRMDDSGTLLAFDPERNQESVWYRFQAPEGEPFEGGPPGTCCGRAVIASRKARYKGPIGEVDYALEVGYPGVFQVGLAREYFLPYIGMVHRLEMTGGPSQMQYDLIYSRTGGVTVVAEPELSFALSLDQSLYTANLMPPVDPRRAVPLMTARLTLRNTTPNPLQLTFPTGQEYDLVIRDAGGQIVFRWSEGKSFTQVIQNVTITHERNWPILVRLGAGDRPLPAGRYVAEAWLTTAGSRNYSASVGFEVRHVF